MASIGVKLAAHLAGNTPKITPIIVDMPTARIIEKRLIYTGKKG
jgi:hypothetical protein